MKTLLALWICANPVNLPAVNDLNGHNNNAVSCANNFNFHKSSHLLYEQPTSWPVREKLNKGIVNEKCFYLVAEKKVSSLGAQQGKDSVFRILGNCQRAYHF